MQPKAKWGRWLSMGPLAIGGWPRGAGRTRLDTIAFRHSTGMLNLFQPREGDERRASITRALLLTISIATTHGFVRAQSSAQRETLPPSSITAQEESGDNQSTSSQRQSSNPEAPGPCTLRVPRYNSSVPSERRSDDQRILRVHSFIRTLKIQQAVKMLAPPPQRLHFRVVPRKQCVQ
jgi:hypothetical protein